MNRTALAVLAFALTAAGACTRPAPAGPHASAGPVLGKPSAPVAVDARLTAGSANVTVRFDADAKDVRIAVHGAGGLRVTSDATPVAHRSFARGETAAFDVAFTPGPGRSSLAVVVGGKFHGAGKRATVASFAVGEPTKEQQDADGAVVESSDGERLKVVVPGR
jgi:hypothetical protein